MRRVVTTLNVRDKPFERQDLSPVSLVNAMNSSRVNATEKAFKKMQKRKATFVIETKFDGERIQVHRTGEREFKYLTRNNIDFHPRGYSVLDRLFRARLKKTTCVLDGELVIWNKREKRYLEFWVPEGFHQRDRAVVSGGGDHREAVDVQQPREGRGTAAAATATATAATATATAAKATTTTTTAPAATAARR